MQVGTRGGRESAGAGAARWPLLVCALLVVVAGLALRAALESATAGPLDGTLAEAQPSGVRAQVADEQPTAGEPSLGALAPLAIPDLANAERQAQDAGGGEGRLLLSVVIADEEPWVAAELDLQHLSPEGLGWETLRAAATDAAGECELEVPGAVRLRLRLRADDEGRSAGTSHELEPFAPGEERAVRLAVPRGEAVFGQVVDDLSRAPLAGAGIRRFGSRSQEFTSPAGSPAIATTGTDGRFRIAHSSQSGVFVSSANFSTGLTTSAGREVLCIELEGYGPMLWLPEAAHGDSAKPFVVPLRRTATLVLRVLDKGSPVSAARLRLETRPYELRAPSSQATYGGQPSWVAVIAGGQAELELPSRVPLAGVLSVPGHPDRPLEAALTLEPGERRELEWDLGVGTQLSGVLLDQRDAPIAGCELWLARRILAGDAAPGKQAFYEADERGKLHAQARTDEQGRFEFDDLPPGALWIGPRGLPESNHVRESAVAPLAVVIVLEPGEQRREIELRSWRGLTIRGRVLDPDGEPARAQYLRATPGDPQSEGAVRGHSDEQGAFVLGPLVPGEYSVQSWVFGGYAPAEPVLAQAGASDVVLRMREPGSLRGTVVDAQSGQPVAASLWVCGDHTEMRRGASADEDGVFESRGLESGTFTLSAHTSDGRAGVLRDVEVTAGATNDELRVEVLPGAKLSIHYQGPATYANFTVFFQGVPVALDGIHTGTTATHVVPTGELEVQVRMRDGAQLERKLSLAPGDHESVQFEF